MLVTYISISFKEVIDLWDAQFQSKQRYKSHSKNVSHTIQMSAAVENVKNKTTGSIFYILTVLVLLCAEKHINCKLYMT